MADAKWRHFERLVAAIHRAADAGADVKWNESIRGRQFDVTIRFRKGLYDHLTVVECKDYDRPVPVEKVEAFVTKSADVHANLAVLASTSGFQSGAQDCAQRHNITLLHVTASDEVDPAIFGARWGASVDMLHIQEITLEYSSGEKKPLPFQSNVLTYYANHIVLQCNSARTTLDAIITQHLQAASPGRSYDDYVIPVRAGTIVVGPEDGEIPLKPLASIRIRAGITQGKTLEGPNKIDPSFLLPDVKILNVNTGERTTFKRHNLELGIDNSFVPGKFYEAPGLGFFYYCEGVKNGIAGLYMVESFQHGQLIQGQFTMEAKYGKRYVPVTDKSTLQRLQRRLDRLKSA